MEKYYDLEERVVNLQNDQLWAKLAPTMKKMKLFMKYLGKFQNQLKKEVAAILVKIRSGHEDIDPTNLIERIENKKFAINPTRLQNWLDEKVEELETVKGFSDQIKKGIEKSMNSLSHPFLEFPEQDELRHRVREFEAKYAFHFVFTSLRHPESILEQMRNHIKDRCIPLCNRERCVKCLESSILVF